jgi:diguanylate cyclase (GGDEF)-like protein/PAS domain S-box-containing protein
MLSNVEFPSILLVLDQHLLKTGLFARQCDIMTVLMTSIPERSDDRRAVERRLLVVDDDSTVLDLISAKLDSDGYAVTTAESAEAALSLVGKADFDLVITDLMLPGIDGFTLTEVLKTKHPAVGVIVITGMTDVDSAVRAMRSGADDYISKPFNLEHMAISVERTLEKQALIIENKNYQQFLEQRVREATRDQRKALTELRETKDYLENLIESSVDAIISFSTEGQVQFCNPGAEVIFGQSSAEIIGHHLYEFCALGKDDADKLIATILLQGKVQNYEIEISSEGDQPLIASISGSVLKDVDGKRIGIIAIFKDISEQKQLELELQDLSIKDNLTSLYNQRHFYGVLQKEMARANRQNHPLCLLLLDLDNFKQLNDTRGHLAGDRILERVGQIMKECTREHVDYSFRYGGDEFTIILTETTPKQAVEVAERIKQLVPDSLEEETLTLSIGLSEFTDSATGLEEFINSADQAMYAAKKAGGNRISIANSTPPPSGV